MLARPRWIQLPPALRQIRRPALAEIGLKPRNLRRGRNPKLKLGAIEKSRKPVSESGPGQALLRPICNTNGPESVPKRGRSGPLTVYEMHFSCEISGQALKPNRCIGLGVSGQARDKVGTGQNADCGVRNWDFGLLDFPAFRVIGGKKISRKDAETQRKIEANCLLLTGYRTAPKVFRKIVKILENVPVSNCPAIGCGFHEHVKTP